MKAKTRQLIPSESVRYLACALIVAICLSPGAVWPQGRVETGAELLRVQVGKSVVVTVPESMERVSIADPAIASSVVVSPQQLVVNGLQPGETSLVLWNGRGEPRAFTLRVEIDLSALSEVLSSAFPAEEVRVGQSGRSIVLRGEITSAATIEKIITLAQAFAPDVVNLLDIMPAPNESQAVLLQVRFAEVVRSVVRELGWSLFSTGAGNTFGSVTTQQFGKLGASVGAIPAQADSPREPQGSGIAAGGIGAPLTGMPAVFGLSDLANIFLFRTDVNLGMTIRALEQRNLLEILAEPNVLALNGREASFLAGGEFPFPVVQGGGNFQSISIVFKEFGVRLKFTPEIRADETIFLKVAPEVSALDFANALTVEGFLIPALTTRRAETEIALKDGQTFAIAGLIDKRTTEVVSKIPGLGDLPLIGKLFRSKAVNESETELLVIVSPKLVDPLDPDELLPLPDMPRPLLDSEEFDSSMRGGKPSDR
ncbi:MAG: pilus assembly protein N-terminal domain-containing protein [Acidobacteriota bacterium]|nr:MAG: pilus assembly protein N-terminal domain-containing protein [Acidobacteriota bacterium]